MFGPDSRENEEISDPGVSEESVEGRTIYVRSRSTTDILEGDVGRNGVKVGIITGGHAPWQRWRSQKLKQWSKSSFKLRLELCSKIRKA